MPQSIAGASGADIPIPLPAIKGQTAPDSDSLDETVRGGKNTPITLTMEGTATMHQTTQEDITGITDPRAKNWLGFGVVGFICLFLVSVFSLLSFVFLSVIPGMQAKAIEHGERAVEKIAISFERAMDKQTVVLSSQSDRVQQNQQELILLHKQLLKVAQQEKK